MAPSLRWESGSMGIDPPDTGHPGLASIEPAVGRALLGAIDDTVGGRGRVVLLQYDEEGSASPVVDAAALYARRLRASQCGAGASSKIEAGNRVPLIVTRHRRSSSARGCVVPRLRCPRGQRPWNGCYRVFHTIRVRRELARPGTVANDESRIRNAGLGVLLDRRDTSVAFAPCSECGVHDAPFGGGGALSCLAPGTNGERRLQRDS